ncbi:MAG: DUF11 domain-containing protein, partial [Chloroflexi bacterium]|nr:DUF11 domain-containing protein [Chloroflexota bacterium]
GQRVKLFAEDEIVVAYRAKKNDKSLENAIMDNSGKNLVWVGNQFFSNFDQLADVRWPAITTADLNGDGKRELVSACRDKQKRIAAITNNAGSTPWYRDGRGENPEWVDVAAGNLDRSSDGDDEVVVAYADNYQEIHLDVLDGNSQGNIAQGPNQTKASYYDYNAGRQDVEYVAVATGDLNGDGYNDEIVTVFRDGNKRLQVLILRYAPPAPGLTLVWSRAWTNHDRWWVADERSGVGNERPIDVTTGDVDGDKRDEVILAFRSGKRAGQIVGQVQLLVLDYQGLDSQGAATFDDRVFLQRDAASTYYADATSVSVSAADLDGDGQDEIALAYNVVGNDVGRNEHWQQHLLTYEFVPPQAVEWQGCTDDQGKPLACLQERPGHWTSAARNIPAFTSEVNPAALVVMDTGDMDRDGKAEIALIRQDHDTGDAQVYSFDADTSLSERSSYAITRQGTDRVEEFWLAMGDINGDSWYGTYSGTCYEKKEAQVTAVVHAPPHWEENTEEAEAGFGQSVGHGAGSGKTAESKIGGSVKVGVQVHEIGPSFTYEWEKSCAVEHTVVTSTVEGVKFVTHPPYLYPEEPYFGAIEFVETKYWCYEYTEPHLGIMAVCLPRPPGETIIYNYPLDWWYNEGITEYPDSWVPVGINLAQGRPATQSSTWGSGDKAGVASRAVDGNTDGSYYHGSASHTGYDTYAWWQVDLDSVQWLDAVSVWNRTDCCADLLSNFYVFVSDEPFTSTNPNDLVSWGIWNHHVTGQGGRPTTVAVNRTGRYVRVQLAGTNYLHMAEVQVWGTPGMVDQWPTARPVTTTVANTFQLAWPGGLQQTVNGQLLYTWNGSQLGIAPSSGAAEFDLGLGKEGETVNEGSTETSASLGMEIKTTEVEITMGIAQKTSYILSWSNDVEFSGVAGGLPRGTSVNLRYSYAPYVWVQRAVASGGTKQAFMVLDYWVPSVGAAAAGTAPATTPETTPSTTLRAGLLVTPTVPLVGSPTHPDPATWYVTSTAVFTWTQPASDPATVDGYRWFLDKVPGTIPARLNLGLATTHTYQGLRDGVWYLHVRARSDGGEWSDTAHRAIRVDVNPPQVRLAVDPPWPTGHNGWYVTPLTVTVTATDATGSGVAAVEVSTDGVTWQPYVAPLSFATDTASTTVWARATDFVGHTSEPISTTFKIDRTPPSSHVSGGQGPGAWVATVITNTLGNSQLTLAGAITDALSGRAGLDLGFDSLDWTSANPIGAWHPIPGHPQIEVNWYFTATTELGRGNHVFYGRAQDEAGNLEAPYELAQVVWFPQDSPDLGGSSLTASPTTVRPGEAVTFTLIARNAGWQEALVAVTDTLPAGLTLITDTLASDVGYNPATGVITWPVRLLWPSQWVWHTFQTRVDAGLGATSLENRATAHAFWPNTESLP